MKTFSFVNILLLKAGILGRRFLDRPAYCRNPGKVQETHSVKRIRERSAFIVFFVLFLALQPFYVSQVSAQDKTIDDEKIERLEQLIKAQQQQLESLQQQLNELKQTAADAKIEHEKAKKAVEKVTEDMERRVDTSATARIALDQPPGDKDVTSGGGERMKLSINGFVNRAVNIIDDGKNTDAYFVDNDNSESRVNFVGTAKATDDLTLGTRIELAIAPNKSGNINQREQEKDNIFTQRWTEASLLSKRFGKLSLGKGNVAAYGTTAVDLSRTTVIAYSGLADTAGGMFFRQKNDDALTDVRIGDAFSNFDGLTRKNRVRYDTPTFYGFQLAGSAFSDQRYDGALFWGGQGYGFKVVAGAGLTDPNEDDTGLRYGGSFSILHEDTGLNLTLSSGKLERDNQSDPYNLYGKIGWLKNLSPVGWTAFSVDYTRSMNLPTDNDDGYSVGLAAVQSFEKFGTELYALYRLHSLDRDVEPGVHDINLLSIGARVKF
jgi:predicted porin/cell division protein FtsB